MQSHLQNKEIEIRTDTYMRLDNSKHNRPDMIVFNHRYKLKLIIEVGIRSARSRNKVEVSQKIRYEALSNKLSTTQLISCHSI